MSSSSSSSSSHHKWLANLDMYRKVPGDLVEGSQQGKIVSWIAIGIMAILFYRETCAFLQPHHATDIHLDNSHVKRVRVDFNITLLDLQCEFATINVVSFLGTQQNITKDIQRYPIHADDLDEGFYHHNKSNAQHFQSEIDTVDIIMHDPDVTQTLEELHQNGKDSIALDFETIEFAVEDHPFVFVKYYANWCLHCRALAPTWERFAEVMHDVEEKTKSRLGKEYTQEEYNEAKRLSMPVLIGEVDCVEHRDLCWDEDIRGYPTLVLYVNGERYKGGEYDGDRTIPSLLNFLLVAEQQTQKEDADKIKQHAEIAIQKHLNMTTQHKEWLASLDHAKSAEARMTTWDKNQHPGCGIVGSLHLDRAPGHFFVEAASVKHELDPHMANLSHIVHHLSFHAVHDEGDHDEESVPDFAPSHYQHAVAPLDGHAFVVHDLHQSWHHYLKLVSTNTDRFQVLKSSQVSLYRTDHVPEAKFVLDISPIAVRWKVHFRPWYDYITSLMAILGGVFTIVGMLESSVTTVARKVVRRSKPRPRPPPRNTVAKK